MQCFSFQIPMQHISEAKRNYGMQDLKDWTKYHGIQFEWTTHFPLKSVLSSRICLVDGDDRLRQTICKQQLNELIENVNLHNVRYTHFQKSNGLVSVTDLFQILNFKYFLVKVKLKISMLRFYGVHCRITYLLVVETAIVFNTCIVLFLFKVCLLLETKNRNLHGTRDQTFHCLLYSNVCCWLQMTLLGEITQTLATKM